MSFVRAKEIPPHSGNWYDYEVRTVHEGKRVIQQHIRYIGRSGSSSTIPNHVHPVNSISRSLNVPIDNHISAKESKPKVVCKFCQSQNTRKYGLYKGVQNYYCSDCHKKFTGTDALAHGKVSPSFIVNALNEYYSGMSFHEIENNIEHQTDSDISHTAVIKWINKYTAEAIRRTKDLHPEVGNKWIADETYIQTDVKTHDPKGIVFWDIIDAKTRFLLASRITTTRSTQDAKTLMELAAKRAGKTPKVVVTDKLAAYIDGIELAYGSDTRHRQGSPFNTETNTSLIERFHNTLKDRTKVMRDLRDQNTLKRFTDGWLVHYNFFRPNMALHGKTPAGEAGLKPDCKGWCDVVGVEKIPIVKTLEPEPVRESA
jgi:transposase-like protein